MVRMFSQCFRRDLFARLDDPSGCGNCLSRGDASLCCKCLMISYAWNPASIQKKSRERPIGLSRLAQVDTVCVFDQVEQLRVGVPANRRSASIAPTG